MNMFKKNGGFTLVELIVVIAILAILAGVAIPAYSGYIQKANEAADVTTLDAIKTAVFGALATYGDVTEIVVKNDGTVTAKYGADDTLVTLTTANGTEPYHKDFKLYFTAGLPTKFATKTEAGATATTATWTKTSAKWSFT